MNKSELVNAIAISTGLTKADAARAVDATTAAITKTLKKGEAVTLVGFGTFKVSQRAARNGRNPRTGSDIKIAARKAPGFSAGKTLKDAVN
jgi:nucleoid DNA-binding protein